MKALRDIVQQSELRSEELVKETCDREGADNVARVVNELVAARAGRYGEALIFLHFGDQLPELREAVARSELGSTLEEMLRTGVFWDRRTAIWVLTSFALPGWREAVARAAVRFEEERDLLTLVRIFLHLGEHGEMPAVVAKLRASSDWLVRWTAITWTSVCLDSAFADEVRRELASDPCRWIAEEARHQVAWVDAYRAKFRRDDIFVGPLPEDAVVTLRFVGAVSVTTSRMSDDPPRSFDAIGDLFVDSWPRDKRDYTVDELRAFFEQVLGAASGAPP